MVSLVNMAQCHGISNDGGVIGNTTRGYQFLFSVHFTCIGESQQEMEYRVS